MMMMMMMMMMKIIKKLIKRKNKFHSTVKGTKRRIILIVGL